MQWRRGNKPRLWCDSRHTRVPVKQRVGNFECGDQMSEYRRKYLLEAKAACYSSKVLRRVPIHDHDYLPPRCPVQSLFIAFRWNQSSMSSPCRGDPLQSPEQILRGESYLLHRPSRCLHPAQG